MQNKVFLTCAVNGSGDTASKHPDLPKTPQQIAKSAIESAQAGASIVHIHVREEDGTPSRKFEYYKEVDQFALNLHIASYLGITQQSLSRIRASKF